MEEMIIGIDIGTTGCKAMIVNSNLKTISDAYFEYDLITGSKGVVEQNAEDWWRLSVLAIKKAISDANINPSQIKALAISSQGISIVPVDVHGRVIHNAISWLDTRANEQTKRIISRYDEKTVFEITGKRISPGYTLPKLIWLKENRADVYAKTHKFLFAHDYVMYKLCKEYITDHTMASGSMAYDIEKKGWWAEILDDFGLSTDKMPDILWSGQIAGKITKEAAFETGLSEDTLIATGGQDQKCAALGAGIKDDIITISLGTATAIEKLCDRNNSIQDMRIPFFSFLNEDKLVLEGVVSTSGAALKWFRNLFCDKKSYADIDKSIAEDKNDADVFFFPFLAGAGSPLWKNGIKAVFWGLDLDTDMTDLSKAVMEGIAFQIRANLDIMEKDKKTNSQIRLFGGGSISDVWCEMICNIVNKKTQASSYHETAGIGAAYLAGKAAGIFGPVYDTQTVIGARKIFDPDNEKVKKFDEKYARYLEIQNKIFRRSLI